jgi:hypothetical protein
MSWRGAGGRGLLVVAALGCAAAGPARAGVEVGLVSVLSARPELREGGRAVTAAPLLELLSLSADGFEVPWISEARLHVSAWGELRPLELGGRDPARGDVQLAFAEGRLWDQRLRLVVGRQMVVGGAARLLHLDGLWAELQVQRGWRLSAWGGAPVSARFAIHQGDAAAGGRLAFVPSWDSELGVSYAMALDRGILSRSDVGLDARWAPSRAVWVSVSALYSALEGRLAEAEVGPHWQVLESVQLSFAARRVAPDLLIPRSSIFSVFAEPERDEVGASVLWEPARELGLLGEYRGLWNEGAPGSDAAVHVVGRLGPARATLLTGQIRLLQLAAGGGYLRARLGASHRVSPALRLTLDGDAFWREQPMNGVRHSAVVSTTASWSFAPEWLAVLSLGAGTTPEYAARVEAMAKVAYRFTAFAGSGEGGRW